MAPAVLDLDPAIETLVSTVLCVAFSSLGYRLRMALFFRSEALKGLPPAMDRCGSAVEEALDSFGQLGIHRFSGGCRVLHAQPDALAVAARSFAPPASNSGN